jgi:methylglutaconyl-CoA hydratase
VAGGVGLAAVMDISIAIDSARFGFSEVRLGVAPAIISVVCLPKMRLGDAQSAFLRGDRFSAVEAARMGLINKAVVPGELDREIDAVVNDLLAGEPHALAVAKQLTFTVPAMSEEEAFAWTAQLSAQLFQSNGAREGMTAFLEKRSASWVEKFPRE